MQLLTLEEVATFIGRTPGAVRKLCLRRAIPYRKLGGRLHFIRDELEVWIKEAPGLGIDEIRKRGTEL